MQQDNSTQWLPPIPVLLIITCVARHFMLLGAAMGALHCVLAFIIVPPRSQAVPHHCATSGAEALQCGDYAGSHEPEAAISNIFVGVPPMLSSINY